MISISSISNVRENRGLRKGKALFLAKEKCWTSFDTYSKVLEITSMLQKNPQNGFGGSASWYGGINSGKEE